MCCRGASSGGRAWRHMPANCIPRRPAHSNVCSQCALGRSATARCPRNAFPSAWRWRYVDVMRSWVSDDGNILPRCIPKRPRTGKGPLRGNISPPCIQNELALARYARHASEKPCKSLLEDTPREYLARKGHFSLHGPLESCTSRRSCHDSAFARPCERKARGAGYRKCTSYCGRRPHHRGCVRLRQPCSITVAAALWPVAQTHDSQCCGERAVSGAYARPAPRHPPACSNLRRRRFSAAARPMTAACSHGVSCSAAAVRTSSVGAPPSMQHKKRPAFRWPFFRGYELSADYSARSFRRRSSSSAS